MPRPWPRGDAAQAGRHGAREVLRWARGSVSSAKAVGAKHFVLGTTQTGNPMPADGLQMFVATLEAAGINRDQIQTMGRETPPRS
jgi:hypothetical protein